MISIEDICLKVEQRREEALGFLIKAVQTPSVTGQEKAVSEVFREQMEKSGLSVNIYEKAENRPNLVAEWTGDQDSPTFVFNGHYDVFPPVPGDDGKYGPWAGKIVDGQLYGRGSVDMKSGLCASVMAVGLLKEMGFCPKGKIVLSCDCDEEATGEYGVDCLLEHGFLNGNFGICAEPTCPPGSDHSKVLVTGSAGMKVEITCRAEAAHASVPHPKTSAIEAALEAMEIFRRYDRQIREERYYAPFGRGPSCSITMIHGGEAFNMHPGCCTFTLDRRLVPTETLEQVKAEIEAIIEQQEKRFPVEYEINFTISMLPYELDPKDPFIQEVLDAYEAVTGEKTELYYRPGGSDAHKIVHKYGICMPNFGPGVDLLATTPDEHIAVDEYLKFIKVYMYLIIKLLGENTEERMDGNEK